ncbi:hypothetical protein VTN00DRAFT_1094 [Thermoascus crustaceus]|uniref:uncharacterized protein n=1 Tax=Thermoascus crustaceus TaxID=5088 RepID=UPI003742AA6B
METIVHIQGNTASPLTPLFLVHAVSGLALPYFALGNLNAKDHDQEKSRPVYGITSPLYSSRTYRTPNSLDEIARQYVTAIQREVQPVGPYLLGGWSMGGMIAVKMADILQSQGEKVLHVIMIDSVNPEYYPSFIDEAEHEAIADLVYSGVAKKMNLPDLSESDGMSTDAEDEDDDDHTHNLQNRTRPASDRKMQYSGDSHQMHFTSANSPGTAPGKKGLYPEMLPASALAMEIQAVQSIPDDFVQRAT